MVGGTRRRRRAGRAERRLALLRRDGLTTVRIVDEGKGIDQRDGHSVRIAGSRRRTKALIGEDGGAAHAQVELMLAPVVRLGAAELRAVDL